ncbi:unnamed protein product [Anisakis simplex]|uniref:t-SNARE coiled-coil homology domain-containing protein n=1 Tax=Anisakis simplex TaxID=6269 RepID=A0A0M3JZW3_ANISI|nr:unnamed protein product [Anisakis simplex]
MFRKNKSRSNLRQRVCSDDENEKEDAGNAATKNENKPKLSENGSASSHSLATANSDLAKKVTKPQAPPHSQSSASPNTSTTDTQLIPKANSLLSFNDLEGDDVMDFKLRKKDQNKRMEKLAKKAKSLRKKELEEDDNVDEMQKSTQSPKSKSKIKQELLDYHNTSSPSNSSKVNSERIKVEYSSPQRDTDDDVERTTRSKFSTTLGQIPDAQAVYEARKKREKLRMSGASGNIPLDDVQKLKDKSVVRSRLIREDDNDMSDEDDGTGRFYSSKTLVIDEDERRRVEQSHFLSIEQGDNENEQSDEEISKWESEQMKKGVSSYKVELLEQERRRMTEMMGAMVMQQQQNYGYINDENNEPLPMDVDMDIEFDMQQGDSKTGSKVSGHTSNVTLDGILSKLRLRINDRDEALNGREAELDKVEKNLKENRETMVKLKSDEPRLNELFTMYQEIRAFSRDLMECLSEKVDEIKQLETRMYSIRSQRSNKLKKRFRQDVHDVYDECSASANGKLINSIRNQAVMQRASEREARRARRRRNRENTLEGISHEDGLSTDDEETNTEITATQLSINEITEASRLIFVDTLDEFSRIDKIMSRFVDWIGLDEKSFSDAYIQLCIPKLLSPFIRIELISWNPLENDDQLLHQMKWYEQLLTCGSSNADLSGEHSIIVSFIPLCIERIVIPRIADMVKDQWDPLSSKQSGRLSALISTLIDECPTLVPTSRSIKRLLTNIRERIQESIDEDLFVPIYSKQAVENAASGCRAFLDRQFWTAIKLCGCVNKFSTILSEDCLKELVVDGILKRSIQLALQCSLWNDAAIIRKCKAIIKSIPSNWWIKYETALKSLIYVIVQINDEYIYSKNRLNLLFEKFWLRKTSLMFLNVQLQRIGDSGNASSDKRHITRKLDQLLAGLRQILDIRSKLSDQDQERFDQRIEPIRTQIQSVVNTLNLVCASDDNDNENSAGDLGCSPKEELISGKNFNDGRNIYADLYEQQTSAAARAQSGPEQMRTQAQIRADELRLKAEQARMDAEESKRLAADIQDLNEIMIDLGQLVHNLLQSQHEIVDSIEENVERSRHHVEAGHRNLKKAQSSQSAKYPLVAAAVGSVALGGPIGIAAGSTIAGVCAAVGGAIAGEWYRY